MKCYEIQVVKVIKTTITLKHCQYSTQINKTSRSYIFIAIPAAEKTRYWVQRRQGLLVGTQPKKKSGCFASFDDQ